MSAPKIPTVDLEFYEQPKTIGYFEGIINSLRIDLDKEGADTSFTSPDLSYFTAHCQKFQLDHLGKEAAEKAKRHRKTVAAGIPFVLFSVHHLSVQSSLYHILKAAYKFKSDHRIKDWRFEAEEEIQLYLQMIHVIKQALFDAGFESCLPHIAFHPSIDDHRKKKMSLSIEGLGGVMVNEITEATHIIYNEEQPLDKHHKIWRVVENTIDDRVIVHWVGLPDSYNTIVLFKDVFKDKEDTTPISIPQDHQKAPWHLKSNWIEDSVKYNEWMSPMDYVMIEQQKQPRTKKKRALDDQVSSPAKKQKDDKPQEPTQDEIALQFMPVQQHEVIIPSYAAWFDIASIHSIETRGLPEFFNSKNKSKNPSVYKDYRDFMINTYRLNPSEYLTVTACRRNMTGDVCAIIRVHAFLEQWGLINYQMDPTAKPTAIGPPFEGQIKIIAELPPGLNKYANEEGINQKEAEANKENLHQTNTTKPNVSSSSASSSSPSVSDTAVAAPLKETTAVPQPIVFDLNLDLRKNIYEKTPKCTVCEKETDDGYQNEAEFICAACFEKKDTRDGFTASKDHWTEQEDLLLLEGLEMFPTDWEQIAQHVATKTREACILHYLKLPTADPRIDPHVQSLGLLNFDQKTPVENPIMSVVAFLASHVKPKVATASSLFANDDQQQEPEGDRTEMDAESERLETTYELIRAKVSEFSSRLANFGHMESVVDEQRRGLEREKFLIRQSHLTIRNQMDSIYHSMFQHRQAKALQEQQRKLAQEAAAAAAAASAIATSAAAAAVSTAAVAPNAFTAPAEPTAAEPTAAEPTAAEPTAVAPTAVAPTDVAPTAAEPTAAAPTAAAPTTAAPTAVTPTDVAPTAETSTITEAVTITETTKVAQETQDPKYPEQTVFTPTN
ncbi:hypothetical protein INT47_012692 [Mucor saturninus]|uniref:Uncharacterized protein n=1 Tax=Mucor saturninus TaxID=64648 RepID=A0A8H7R3E3_9FUNG|nr:hypothetical protein INT47_012692 [Mucor saturninus]